MPEPVQWGRVRQNRVVLESYLKQVAMAERMAFIFEESPCPVCGKPIKEHEHVMDEVICDLLGEPR